MQKIILSSIAGVIVLAGLVFGVPQYFRYQTLQNAKNELAAQQFLKQVAIATAESKSESAKFEADAEIIRAGGVAKANQIIGDSLKNNESYLKYLWINNMKDNQKEVIYVPTETNLPILEAGKR
jgi:hypothetical protein